MQYGVAEGVRTNGAIRRTHQLTSAEVADGWTCVKRDGSVVTFDCGKIAKALFRCFHKTNPFADQPTIPADQASLETLVTKLVKGVVNSIQGEHKVRVEVEHVQRLIIQQLWGEGLFEAAEHYSNYRESRRQARLARPVSPALVALVAQDKAKFPTPLQHYQYVSKFSRWLEHEQRRETWTETTYDRVIPWLKAIPAAARLSESEWVELADAMYNLEVSPAMRVVQMAGPALDRCHVGVFNCAYEPIEDLFAFPELLYTLMQGTGTGFSCEFAYVSQLPRIEKQKGLPPVEIVVEDTTEGWCDAYHTSLKLLFAGMDFTVDTSRVRKKGSRLKIKGGKASGPAPLQELLAFTRKLVFSRQGRFLEDIDVHDLCCMTGRIVQVGGVRRAAEISLSDLDSTAMRNAKAGNWYEHSVYRTMANNSAVYDYETVPVEVFMEEWLSLVKSKSGERGIFNRAAAERHKPARRKSAKWGVNPCVPDDTWVHTTDGARRVADLVGKPFVAVVDGVAYNSPTGFVKTGDKPVFRVTLSNGVAFEATGNHQVLAAVHQTRKVQRTAWREVAELTPGDLVVLHNHRGTFWVGRGTRAEGELLGSWVGDGTTSGKQAHLDYWGDHRREMADATLANVKAAVGTRSDNCGSEQTARVGKRRVSSTGVRQLMAAFGVGTDHTFGDAIEETGYEFYVGFLRKWFDADGTVGGDQLKGVSVRLSSSILANLHRAQRMLARIGVNSVIYENRRDAGYRDLPDGRGGLASYWCKATHDLAIANDNLQEFAKIVGFSKPDKQAKLAAKLLVYTRKLNRERFAEKIVSIVAVGTKPVYDCTVPGPGAFDANGCYLHNCGEICLRPYEFCNLSIAVARPTDTEKTLTRKVRLATIFGKLQSLCTNFRYIRKEWKENCEEERLLGVDITGHADCPLLHFNAPGRAALIARLAKVVEATDVELSTRFEVPRSAASTTVKPGGDSAVLFNCASGVSPRFAKYIMRWVRETTGSPVARFLADSGVPNAPAPEAPDWLTVFGFPVEAPAGSTLRNDMTAETQFRNWLVWKQAWAEHSVSATIYVEDHEWPSLGALVYENINHVTGLCFLPKDNGTYKYAPNEELTEAQYVAAMETFPALNWAKLPAYEEEDATEASFTAACSGDRC